MIVWILTQVTHHKSAFLLLSFWLPPPAWVSQFKAKCNMHFPIPPRTRGASFAPPGLCNKVKTGCVTQFNVSVQTVRPESGSPKNDNACPLRSRLDPCCLKHAAPNSLSPPENNPLIMYSYFQHIIIIIINLILFIIILLILILS
jgi:hypothetical protein